MNLYRIVFEMVYPNELWRFLNPPDPAFKNTKQTVPNSEIPDLYWHQITTPGTTDPWAQHSQLSRWDQADEQFVRNVRLEIQTIEPVWKEHKP